MNSDRFRKAMRLYASGVCVVASGTGEDRQGLTVSAVSSVSADPPMILVCLNRSAQSHRHIVAAKQFSVNILRADDDELAMTFAGQSGLHGARKFDVGTWSCSGAPILVTALQSLLCEPAAQHDAGSHTILIGRVIDIKGGGVGPAMVNFDGALRAIQPLRSNAA